jgi:hypothetical protein
MFEIIHDELLDAARSDHETRSLQHARDCVLLAVVTSEAVAAELIDQAIAIHAIVGKGSDFPQPDPDPLVLRAGSAATCREDTMPHFKLRLPAG